MKTALIISVFYFVIINSCNRNQQNTSKPVSSESNIPAKDSVHTIEKSEEVLPKKHGDHFILLNAISENWVAGIPDGGSGTEYFFKVKINSSEKINFDSIWTDNKSFSIFISKEKISVSSQPVTFNKGDTITLRASYIKNQSTTYKSVSPPQKHEGAALIGYSVNGTVNYFSVKEIKKQKTLNRP